MGRKVTKKSDMPAAKTQANRHESVTDMFLKLVLARHIVPIGDVFNMRLPGEFEYVPSIVTYGTHDTNSGVAESHDAQLGHRS